ncbi:DUF6632 domain-containing protein [Stutzerimonas stutzeri]|nr:DUF6632 domain-containing protein [Stutzerimonas stutzeri]
MLGLLPELIEQIGLAIHGGSRLQRSPDCHDSRPCMMFWPSGWAWHVGHSDYPLMIVGIYATLGVFLIRAARDPLANLSLIWFTVWSSAVHGAIMAAQAVTQPGQMGHLAGDVPALFIVAVALAILTPRTQLAARPRTHDGA